jgi:hypothetical protein
MLWLHPSNKPCFQPTKDNIPNHGIILNNQSLEIKLNPYAIEKHKSNEEKLIHYKSSKYYQSRCGKAMCQIRKTKCNKFQENLNDHNGKRKLCYKYQECHQSNMA